MLNLPRKSFAHYLDSANYSFIFYSIKIVRTPGGFITPHFLRIEYLPGSSTNNMRRLEAKDTTPFACRTWVRITTGVGYRCANPKLE